MISDRLDEACEVLIRGLLPRCIGTDGTWSTDSQAAITVASRAYRVLARVAIRHVTERIDMSENIEEARGRVKQAAGSLIDDEDLKEEGAAQQDKANAEQNAERAEREAIDARKEAAAYEERQERA